MPLCRECGGRCCHGSPGIWIDPERFFALFYPGERLTVEELRGRLPTLGLVFWGKEGVPIPAPRSLASGCAFLGIDGCRLSIVGGPATLSMPRDDSSQRDPGSTTGLRLPGAGGVQQGGRPAALAALLAVTFRFEVLRPVTSPHQIKGDFSCI